MPTELPPPPPSHEPRSRRAGWAWGVASLVPLAYVTVFLALPSTRLFFAQPGWRFDAGLPSAPQWLAMASLGLVVVWTGVLLVRFGLHLATSPRVSEPDRLPWVLLFVMASVLVLPAYWWIHMRPGPVEKRPDVR